MSTPHSSLSSAAGQRKARLAQLRSLKRKLPGDEVAPPESEHVPSQPTPSQQPDEEDGPTKDSIRNTPPAEDNEATAAAAAAASQRPRGEDDDGAPDVARLHLSGRNYDADSRGARLGFEHTPRAVGGAQTLEERAAELEAAVRRQREEEAQAGKAGGGGGEGAAGGDAAAATVDLFKLQPRKPNWDLRRDLDRKLEILDVRTDAAVARLVRERIAAGKEARLHRAGGAPPPEKAKGGKNGTSSRGRDDDDDDGEDPSVDGIALVEGLRQREREEAEDERRERAEEQAED